jgi:nickel-dependent lactate racemase
MKVHFAYGTKGLDLDIPDDLHAEVVRAKPEQPLADPHAALIAACEKPLMTKSLRVLLEKRSQGKICVVISDSTRPVPSKIIMTALCEIFRQCEIPDEEIQILIATGLHRKSTPAEIKGMIGQEFMDRFDIINHVAEDSESLEYLGENSFGTPVYINKVYLNAAFKIITGYCEPHFFAGFAGGRKSIVPGIAGESTITANHSAKNIASSNARFGILKNNPIYEDALEIAKMPRVRPDFLVNVCINPQHQITKVVAGALQAYNELVQYQEQLCFFPIKEPYDVIISGNGGAPLDLNLYQAVKSMAIGELGVKKGGTVITVNECRDGVGQPKFQELINLGICAEEMFTKVSAGEIRCKDQWEIQALARVLTHADVYVVSSMTPEELGKIGLKYAKTVNDALVECRKKYGDRMRVLILPDGPAIIPKLI